MVDNMVTSLVCVIEVYTATFSLGGGRWYPERQREAAPADLLQLR
jgi:hypothetical protein